MSYNVRTFKRGNSFTYSFEAPKLGDNKRNRITKGGFKTAKEARSAGLAAAKELALAIEASLDSKDSSLPYAEFLIIWLNDKRKTVSATTIQNYDKLINNYIKCHPISQKAINKISTNDLDKFVNLWLEQQMCFNTLENIIGILSNSFSFAYRKRYISENPMFFVTRPKRSIHRNKNLNVNPHPELTSEDVNRILEHFVPFSPEYTFILLGYKCGLRLGETLAITWDDIDFDNKTLFVRKQILRMGRVVETYNGRSFFYLAEPKYGSKRMIDLDDDLIGYLRELKKRIDDTPPKIENFFLTNGTKRINHNGEGEKIQFVNQTVDGAFLTDTFAQKVSRTINKDMGIPFHYHSLRHLHSNMLQDAGVQITYVQHRLGHKHPELTTQTYRRMTSNSTEQGRAALNNIFK